LHGFLRSWDGSGAASRARLKRPPSSARNECRTFTPAVSESRRSSSGGVVSHCREFADEKRSARTMTEFSLDPLFRIRDAGSARLLQQHGTTRLARGRPARHDELTDENETCRKPAPS
jgi:hypothetical protein